MMSYKLLADSQLAGAAARYMGNAVSPVKQFVGSLCYCLHNGTSCLERCLGGSMSPIRRVILGLLPGTV